MKEWEVLYVMPNLSLRESFESDYIAIVPYTDDRVQTCMKKSSGTKKLVDGFVDSWGKKIEPSVLIIASDSPSKVMTTEALVGFRNIVALSTVLPGYSNVVPESSQLGPMYTDFFDFYPVTVGTAEGLKIITPALRSHRSADAPFSGMSAPHLPLLISLDVEKVLYKSLLKKWKNRFIYPAKNSRNSRVLFRSLEIAYHALSTPVKNQSTLYDYGVNMALWVSSLEILAHPYKGTVSQTVVLDLLSKYIWGEKELNHRRYRAKIKSKKESISLIQKLYKQMYDARNDFLHGNDVNEKIMYPFGDKKLVPIIHLAPIVYRTGLYAFLQPRVEKYDVGFYIVNKIYDEGLLKLISRECDIV